MKEEKRILSDFCIQFKNQILQKKIDMKKFKQTIFNYFNKNNTPKPSNKIIAEEFILILLRNSKICQEQLEKIISNSDYLSKYVKFQTISYFETRLNQEREDSTIHSEIDLNQITDSLQIEQEKQKLESIIEEKKQEIEKNRRESEKQLEEKRKELKLEEQKTKENIEKQMEEFRSKIDFDQKYDHQMLIESFKKKRSNFDEYKEWWEILGLYKDPFPRTDGFNGFSEEEYEDIIIKIPLVQKYEMKIKTNINGLVGQSIIFFGEFGCGKTTLFDYLKPYIVNQNYIPLTILLNAGQNAPEIEDKFLKRLSFELNKEISKYFGPFCFNSFSIEEIAQQMINLVSQTTNEGFFLFLDGLHKLNSNLDAVLGFLRLLQNSIDFLSRNDLKICISIAGSMIWKDLLERGPSFSGTISIKETFSSISSENAYELIWKRLEHYSDNDIFTNYIGKPDIIHLVKITENKYSRKVTFREVIDEFRSRINTDKLGNFRIKLDIDESKLRNIQSEFFKFIKIKTALETIRNSEYLDSIISILDIIHRTDCGIPEESEYFEKNSDLFLMLYQEELILKNIVDQKIFWILSKDFQRIAEKILREQKLELRHYLKFIITNKRTVKQSFINEIFDIPKQLMELSSSIEKYRNDFRNTYNFITDSFKSLAESLHFKNKWVSIEDVTQKVDFILEKYLLLLFKITHDQFIGDIQKYYSQCWLAPEFFPDFIASYDNFKTSGYPLKEERDKFLLIFNKAIKEITLFIQKQFHLNELFILGNKNLTREEKGAFNDIRELYFSQKFENLALNLFTMYEEKTRRFQYILLNLCYGENWKKKLPKDIQDYIKSQTEKYQKKFSGVFQPNDLFYCSRGQYIDIFNKNWGIFSNILISFSKHELSNLVNQLTKYANPNSHNMSTELYDRHSEEFRGILSQFLHYCEDINLAFQNFTNGKFVTYSGYKISWNIPKIKCDEITVDAESAKDLIKKIDLRIKNLKTAEIELCSINESNTIFHLDYRSFISLLALGIAQKYWLIHRFEGSNIFLIENKDRK